MMAMAMVATAFGCKVRRAALIFFHWRRARLDVGVVVVLA